MTTRNLPFLAAVLALALIAGPASAAELLQDQPFLPVTRGQTVGGSATRVQVIADRIQYLTDDLNGQFLVTFLGAMKPEGEPAWKIVLSLKDAAGQEIAVKTIAPVKSPKLPLLIPVSELKPGRYTLAASLLDKDGKPLHQPSVGFTVSDQNKPHVAFPNEGIAINVHPQDFVPDASWPISTGVPMPVAALKDISALALLEDGKPIPVQFSVRATWSPRGYIKWVGVDFVAQYDKGIPRRYVLVQDPAKRVAPARPLSLKDDGDRITVDTGAIRFQIGRKPFAGLEKVWVDRDGNGTYSDQELVASGQGGPFIVDDKGTRYDSIHAKDVKLVVEESGPVSALIAAKGWYADDKGDPLCQFVIRFKVYAGQSSVAISHRAVNTIYDQYYTTKLADVGFETVAAGKVEKWRSGFDGKIQAVDAPAQGSSVFIHQDRSDHFRLMNNDAPLAEGKRSDGWMNASGAAVSITCFLRDIYQKFPKEMELDTSGDRAKLVVHFWPKHGHQAFTDEEELSRQNIYKARFAEQGKLLNFVIPDNYLAKLKEFQKAEDWDNGHDLDHHVLDINGAPKDRVKLQNETSIGTVIGGDLVLWFGPKPEDNTDLQARARLVQQSPHGIADPLWNCATDVWGPVAPRDPVKFGPAEKLLDNAFIFYRRAIIDGSDEYGMWTYGDLHEDFRPNINAADLYRVWQHDHYQNVFQSWLLYFRSGLPDAYDWARIEANHHLDVGVNNYYAFPPGKHAYSSMGDIGGTPHHWGVLPWTGTLSDMHWLDIANYFIQFDLTGDRRGLDLAELWAHSRGVFRFPVRPVIPAAADGFQSEVKMAQVNKFLKDDPGLKPDQYPQWVKDERAKPEPFAPRDFFVPLGETVQYYQGTWDPEALLYLDSLAQYMNPPIEVTGGNAPLSTFGKHWQDWYYGLTRDTRVIDHIRSYLKSDLMTDKHPAFYSFAAFLYHAAGDKTFLEPIVSKMYGETLNIYDCPGDRYDGYCMAQSNPAAMLFGRLPYFLHAVDAAGLKFEHSEASTSIPARSGRNDSGDKWLSEPRGWSNTSLTVLALSPTPSKLALTLDAPAGFGDRYFCYELFYGFPELNAFARPKFNLKDYEQQQRGALVKLEAKDPAKDPPTMRIFNSDGQRFYPFVERPSNDPARREYRLEFGGTPINLPVFLDATTDQPLPQVAVIPRMTNWERNLKEAYSSSRGVMDAWFRPLNDRAAITFTVESLHTRYYEPTTVRISDAKGAPMLDSSVFMYGQRKKITVTLDPNKNPLPWRIVMASSGDNRITFTGADELFFAAKKADLAELLPRIPIYRP